MATTVLTNLLVPAKRVEFLDKLSNCQDFKKDSAP
jgi:hypothetical protein